MLGRLFATQNTLSYTFLRIAVGAVMLPHGIEKVMKFQETLGKFTNPDGMNVPPWLGVLAIVAESAGAVGLILGLLTRICALGMLGVMAGAIYWVHGAKGFNWGEGGYQPHVVVIGASLALLIGGGGALSVDQKLAKKK